MMTHDPQTPDLQTYAEFWPFYLGEHRRRGTRALHLLGTALGLGVLVVAAVAGDWRWIIAAVAAGYAFAWVGHALIERNRPATFRYPLWSLASDLRLFALFVSGRLRGELAKYGFD